jgi:hypothetical protein
LDAAGARRIVRQHQLAELLGLAEAIVVERLAGAAQIALY